MNIPLTKGYYAFVDEVDYEALRAIGHWSYSPSGYAVHYSKDQQGNRRTLYMHRIIMDRILGHPVGHLQVDHISSVEMGKAARRDYRRQNLRLATPPKTKPIRVGLGITPAYTKGSPSTARSGQPAFAMTASVSI